MCHNGAMPRRRLSYFWPTVVLLVLLVLRLGFDGTFSTWLPDEGSPAPPSLPPTTPAPESLPQERLEGQVRHIFDGDTLELVTADGTWRVRLVGIDAPEYDQPFGRKARKELVALCERQRVEVWVRGRDSYNRLLGDVYRDDVWVNGQMVRAGYAWHWNRDGRAAGPLETLQEDARRARRGLWRDRRPTAPWDHRDRQRQRQTRAAGPSQGRST
jgi:endonuclease YncB( thermonuclease family)